MAETGTDPPTRTFPTKVDERAPVFAASEIEIAAPPEAVWEVLTKFENWPTWNRDVKSMSVEGPVAEGTIFRWRAGPGTITSTIGLVEPPHLIAWTGKTFGVNAIHYWWLEPRDGKTFVRTEESYEGLVARSSAAGCRRRSTRRSQTGCDT
jgi:uncharacterized protein YndB with AHSA1/START domain